MKIRRVSIIAGLVFVFLAGSYIWVDRYLKSSSANCEDAVIKSLKINGDLSATWIRRNCGMLYGGGPYTVIRLRAVNLPFLLVGDVEAIEIEDDSGNFQPVVAADANAIVISNVPDYLKYKAPERLLGRKLIVKP